MSRLMIMCTNILKEDIENKITLKYENMKLYLSFVKMDFEHQPFYLF